MTTDVFDTAARPQRGGDAQPVLETAGNRLLVVDDDANLRILLRLALQSNGFEVMTAADGREALALVRLLRPDALVLDVMMPHLDGFQVVERLHEDDMTPATLFLTARDNHDDRARARMLGADYMTKPFRLAELITRVQQLLSR
jgi:two-component system OmpR family response regulator